MENKMFVHIALKAKFTEELLSKYTNSIVFIKDTQEIYTHGTFYAIPEAWQNKVTGLESAVSALKEVYAFTGVSDGQNTGKATATAKTITFTGTGSTTVTVNEQGVTINSTDYTDAIADAKKAGTDAKTALDGYKTTNDAAVGAAQADATQALSDAADALEEALAKVASVTAGSKGIVVNGTDTEPTVALKLDNSGNVKFTETDAGLKGTVTIDVEKVEVPVTGIKTDEKVIALDGTLLYSTLKLNYNSDTKKLQLLGKDNAVVHEISADAFVKDGMISNIEYDQDTHKLSITFNTDAGDVTIDDIDLSDLVDIYEEGNGIKLTDGEKGKKINIELNKTTETQKYLSVGAEGLKLEGVDAAITKAVGDAVADIDEYTVNGKAISENPELTGEDITLKNYTKGTDASAVGTSDTVNKAVGKLENQIAAVKATAEAAISEIKVTDGTYVKATVSGNTITINDSAVENVIAWEEL